MNTLFVWSFFQNIIKQTQFRTWLQGSNYITQKAELSSVRYHPIKLTLALEKEKQETRRPVAQRTCDFLSDGIPNELGVQISVSFPQFVLHTLLSGSAVEVFPNETSITVK